MKNITSQTQYELSFLRNVYPISLAFKSFVYGNPNEVTLSIIKNAILYSKTLTISELEDSIYEPISCIKILKVSENKYDKLIELIEYIDDLLIDSLMPITSSVKNQFLEEINLKIEQGKGRILLSTIPFVFLLSNLIVQEKNQKDYMDVLQVLEDYPGAEQVGDLSVEKVIGIKEFIQEKIKEDFMIIKPEKYMFFRQIHDVMNLIKATL